ncbi:hypothetical protein [Pseudomonas sp. TWI929]|uniref:hypothetical protein n=1 Tax=Pseudomonas sp. TWI929 TaxID=3136795 RepID=UPI0032084480
MLNGQVQKICQKFAVPEWNVARIASNLIFSYRQGGEIMFGKVLTYDVYHLALYLVTAMAWGAAGLWLLLRGAGVEALYRCCAMFGLALTISSVMLVLDIFRVLEHWQVELGLLLLGVLLPCVIVLTFRAGLAGK